MNKPLFYTYEKENPLEDVYSYVHRPTANRVKIVDWLETFAFQQEAGNWKIYEATTGTFIHISRWCKTRKQAVEEAKKSLEYRGEQFVRDSIEKFHKNYGISPYVTDSLSIKTAAND